MEKLKFKGEQSRAIAKVLLWERVGEFLPRVYGCTELSFEN